MTPVERIDARIAVLEARRRGLDDTIDELRALRAELLDAQEPALGQGPVGPQTYRDDKEHVPAGDRHGGSPPEQPPVKPKRGRPPKEPAAGKGPGPASREGHVRAVLLALADRPHTQRELCGRLSIPKGSISQVMKLGEARGWWQRGAVGLSPPWELTEAGRAALAAGAPT